MKKINKKIPKNSGVYFFKSAKGAILYIGKAANLKARLSSYFQKGLEPRIAKMVEEASAAVWKKTRTEIDALILEAALIKKHSPKYNILMRDGKNYFFVGFTQEEFPKIFITHQPDAKCQSASRRTNAKCFYIGPFTDGGALKNVLRSLRKTFPYCSCFGAHGRPCLRAHLKRCAGACCLKKEARVKFYSETEFEKIKKDYLRGVSLIKKILLGERESILKKLKKEMKKAAAKQDFEKAAGIRDQVFGLESVFAHRSAVSDFLKNREEENREITGDFKKFFGISFPVSPAGGLKGRIEIYDISNISGEFAVGAMVVFKDGVRSPSDFRRFKIKSVFKPNDPAMLKEVIGRRLNRVPSAKLAGGRADWPLPNLMIIDGGAGQLSAAREAAENFFGKRKTPFPIIALAKGKGEIYPPTKNTASGNAQITKRYFSARRGGELYDRNSGGVYRAGASKISLFSLSEPARLFLERARDEAHNFAVKYHRRRRSFRGKS